MEELRRNNQVAILSLVFNFQNEMKIINDTYKGSVRYVAAQTEGVCSQAIELLVEGDVILDAAFHGGCNGNLKGIVALCKGQKISDVQERLAGITCGGNSTSCPDQFAQLLKLVSEQDQSY